jgi:hypothetical protein
MNCEHAYRFCKEYFLFQITFITKVVIQTCADNKYLLNEDMDLISTGCLFHITARENKTCSVILEHS